MLLFLPSLASADFVFTVSNAMMNQTTPSSAEIALVGIDPYNPSAHCASFQAPSTCSVDGNMIEWNMVFDYSLSMTGGGSIDVSFLEHDNIGNMGNFTVLSTPNPINGLTDGMTGTFEYSLSFPYFSSYKEYGLLIEVDITFNP